MHKIQSMKVIVNIESVIEKSSAILYSDGLKICTRIKEVFDKGESVTLSFKGVGNVTTAFLTALMVELHTHYSRSYINDMLSIVDISDVVDSEITERKIKKVRLVDFTLPDPDHDQLLREAYSS
ncbi:hypothetical protein COB64_03010 [Candidatus Wolfebacteria bacterium]|nr:MAG: hypothetical protein COB64_03010 [Candidatus Wolfebacteria bacterium]